MHHTELTRASRLPSPRWITPFQMASRWLAVWMLAMVCVAPLAARAQDGFATPEQASDALIAAVVNDDSAAMQKLLGKDWRKLMPPKGITAEDRRLFGEKAAAARSVRAESGRGVLLIGADEWALPIPLQQGKDGQWRFDPRGGREAILERTIGSNELSAMKAALAYVDAQREYAQVDRNGDGVLEYARKLVSSKGQRDGLIWSPELGDDSPLGSAFLPSRPGEGYHGYRFRILTEQGSHANGGARKYLIGKRMVNGYALVAWPVTYGVTGVMTFIVNHEGELFERNLGPNTSSVVAGISRFDPDTQWRRPAP